MEEMNGGSQMVMEVPAQGYVTQREYSVDLDAVVSELAKEEANRIIQKRVVELLERPEQKARLEELAQAKAIEILNAQLQQRINQILESKALAEKAQLQNSVVVPQAQSSVVVKSPKNIMGQAPVQIEQEVIMRSAPKAPIAVAPAQAPKKKYLLNGVYDSIVRIPGKVKHQLGHVKQSVSMGFSGVFVHPKLVMGVLGLGLIAGGAARALFVF